jgi:hypothetical protein
VETGVLLSSSVLAEHVHQGTGFELCHQKKEKEGKARRRRREKGIKKKKQMETTHTSTGTLLVTLVH